MTLRLPPGLALGALGVLCFSFSLPATRVAVGGLDPWFVALGRAAGAGVLALVIYGWPRVQLRRLAVVAGGVVLGFPILTSLALHHVAAGHGAVVVAVLPAATAAVAVVRGGERASRAFWLAAGLGLLAVLAFVLTAGGVGGFGLADLELLGAVALCAGGYAEGGALARELGGARVIAGALVLVLPITVPGALLAVGHPHADAGQWLCFGYVTLVSSFLGFVAWYAGLARGGVARVGQVQLAQPVLSLGWAALLLAEPVGVGELVTALAVLGCVVLTQRART